MPPAVKCTAPNQDNDDDLHQEGEVAPSCEVTAQQSLSFLLMRRVSDKNSDIGDLDDAHCTNILMMVKTGDVIKNILMMGK